MRSDLKFNFLLALLTVGVMAALGLLLDILRAIFADVGDGLKDRFVMTLSMAALGGVIALGQSIGFYWRRRRTRR